MALSALRAPLGWVVIALSLLLAARGAPAQEAAGRFVLEEPIVVTGGARAATVAVSHEGRVALAAGIAQGTRTALEVHQLGADRPLERKSLPRWLSQDPDDRPAVGFRPDGGVWVGGVLEDGSVSVMPLGSGPGFGSGATPGSRNRRLAFLSLRRTYFDLESDLLGLWNGCPGGKPAHHTAGVGGEEGGALRTSISPLSNRVCGGCRPALAARGQTVFIAYRGEATDGTRDHYVARWPEGSESMSTRRASTEGYRGPCARQHGPALAALGERELILAYVLPDATPKVLVAVSSDDGATFASPCPVGAGEGPQLSTLRGRKRWFVALVFDGPGGVLAALSPDGGRTFAAPLRVDRARPGTRASGVALAREPDELSLRVSWIERPEADPGAPGLLLVRRVTLAD